MGGVLGVGVCGCVAATIMPNALVLVVTSAGSHSKDKIRKRSQSGKGSKRTKRPRREIDVRSAEKSRIHRTGQGRVRRLSLRKLC